MFWPRLTLKTGSFQKSSIHQKQRIQIKCKRQLKRKRQRNGGNRNRLVFDKNHEGCVMKKLDWFSMLSKKRWSKGVRRILLDESNYLLVLWESKTAFIPRNYGLNASDFSLVCIFLLEWGNPGEQTACIWVVSIDPDVHGLKRVRSIVAACLRECFIRLCDKSKLKCKTIKVWHLYIPAIPDLHWQIPAYDPSVPSHNVMSLDAVRKQFELPSWRWLPAFNQQEKVGTPALRGSVSSQFLPLVPIICLFFHSWESNKQRAWQEKTTLVQRSR